MPKLPIFFVTSGYRRGNSAMNKRKSGGGQIFKGVVFILLGLFTWLWASGHSPHMGYSEMLSNRDNWVFLENRFITDSLFLLRYSL